ncbi:secretin N-terminal domain-containing protein [Pelomonas sp. APW6]|uniref:Secretin N-terminal domain-containing protein n=1 Tax=Roseateles subflavus TaxID=3053353 RepID=A0ABT7LNU6_9BURK|nr:pilus (MSHA type) biogenesis protein MshL [Pelomonas sp. APW6]MDL5034532.1 secretin N-terminal domain-containing protein [Pelomonas sp. APW6]
MKRPAQSASRPAARQGPQRLGNAALVLGLGLLSACAEKPLQVAQPVAALRAELDAARARATEAEAQAAARAASAPATPATPPVSAPAEPRFDLVVNGAQAKDVYLSLVADTRYSMIVHPGVSGQLSLTLKGVTMREALESLRDVYGYDFRIDGRRVTVYPATMQTRVFSINYLPGQRIGRSELRVSTGARMTGTSNGSSSNGVANSGTGTSTDGNNGSNGTVQQSESSRVSTATKADFWSELQEALNSLVGGGEGRSVIASPQASTIAVRAMPEELRAVESFLKATRMAVERQVMLEAKIVEVELREGYQSGVDWSILRSRTMAGQTSVNPSLPLITPSVVNPLVGNTAGLPTLSTGNQTPLWPDLIPLPSAGGGAFGLALTRGSFQGLISFLESHGDTQILSSPRVATLNNQKAVLKVGSDDYFVTGINSGNTTNSTNTNNTTGVVMPTLILTPFFSGIALDVTPQIDDGDTITLHVHPSVTNVTERTKQVDLGAAGNYRLPLASSSVNETDTVVRVPDGAIVAIGGLMQQESTRRGSGLPGADQNPITATLLGNRANNGRKRELVVLIRSTIIRSAQDWEQETARSAQRLEDTDARQRKVIRVGQP